MAEQLQHAACINGFDPLMRVGNRSSLCVGSRTDGNHIVRRRACTDVLNPMLFVGVNEAETARSHAMADPIDSKFDRSFTDKPHLGVEMMMRWMWGSIRGQRRLVRFDVLPRCQFALYDLPDLCMLGVLDR